MLGNVTLNWVRTQVGFGVGRPVVIVYLCSVTFLGLLLYLFIADYPGGDMISIMKAGWVAVCVVLFTRLGSVS